MLRTRGVRQSGKQQLPIREHVTDQVLTSLLLLFQLLGRDSLKAIRHQYYPWSDTPERSRDRTEIRSTMSTLMINRTTVRSAHCPQQVFETVTTLAGNVKRRRQAQPRAVQASPNAGRAGRPFRQEAIEPSLQDSPRCPINHARASRSKSTPCHAGRRDRKRIELRPQTWRSTAGNSPHAAPLQASRRLPTPL